MKKIFCLIFMLGFSVSGCSSTTLSDRLDPMKNPHNVFKKNEKNEFAIFHFNVLREPYLNNSGNYLEGLQENKPEKIQTYLESGFALSDLYCDDFLNQIEESQRRRKFGRALSSDAGAAITTILGLASAGQGVVAGSAAFFGLADSTWRQYDDAFTLSPDTSSIRNLVNSAKDAYRAEIPEFSRPTFPKNYSKAQSYILRYANICSTLGIQGLLNQSTNQQIQELKARKEAAQPDSSKGNDGSEELEGISATEGVQRAQANVPVP